MVRLGIIMDKAIEVLAAWRAVDAQFSVTLNDVTFGELTHKVCILVL